MDSTSPKKPTDLSILSFIVTAVFNPTFGLLAYHYTASAKHRWHKQEYTKSRRYTRYAILFIILGIIIGVSIYGVGFSLYFVIKTDSSCASSPSDVSNAPDATISSFCCTNCPITQPSYYYYYDDQSSGMDTCSLYCTSVESKNGPINFPDINGKYDSCCLDINCGQPIQSSKTNI